MADHPPECLLAGLFSGTRKAEAAGSGVARLGNFFWRCSALCTEVGLFKRKFQTLPRIGIFWGQKNFSGTLRWSPRGEKWPAGGPPQVFEQKLRGGLAGGVDSTHGCYVSVAYKRASG